MRLELSNDGRAFSEAEQLLVEKVRNALAGINFQIKENIPEGIVIKQVVTALVYINPLRVDLKAHVPGEIGQAFIGGPWDLTDELFEGNGLSSKFKAEIDGAVKQYRQYLRSEL